MHYARSSSYVRALERGHLRARVVHNTQKRPHVSVSIRHALSGGMHQRVACPAINVMDGNIMYVVTGWG